MTFLNNKNLMFAYKLARKARKNKQEVIFKYCLLDYLFMIVFKLIYKELFLSYN